MVIDPSFPWGTWLRATRNVEGTGGRMGGAEGVRRKDCTCPRSVVGEESCSLWPEGEKKLEISS